MAIKTPLCDLLGIEHPVMLAGMGGVSFSAVCGAVSAAGGFGTLGMMGLKADEIRAEIHRVREITDKPFGVDMLAAYPKSLAMAVDIVIEEKVKAFVSGLGIPEEMVGKLHDAGVLVINMCGTVRHAVKAAEAGCDLVVAQGTEGGGHTGRVAGMALLPQIIDAVDIPVVAAGSIYDGRGLAAALALGADGIWMGTRFIASTEAHAGQLYKESIVTARDEDTIVTKCYSGKPMRVLRNPYVEDWESRPEDILPFPDMGRFSKANNVLGGVDGNLNALDADRDCMPCGQGAGGIGEILSCADIVNGVVAEAEATIGRIAKLG